MQTTFRTLRFKVAGAFLLWTAVFQIALVLLIPLIRERLVLDQFDGRIRAEAVELARGLRSGELTPAKIAALPTTTGNGQDGRWGFLYQVQTAHGVVASPHLEADPVPMPETAPGADGITLATVQTNGGGEAEPSRFRVAVIDATPPGGEPMRLTVAASLATAEWMGRVIRWILIAALIPGLLGAALAGWIVAGLTVARIEEVRAAVRAVSPTRLDQRVHVADHGDEISRMASDINGMLDRLANTISGMERFMSEVSHELKTPVSALLAEAQVMKYSKPTPESAGKFILSVEDEMRRLGKLVESFLMLARFEHGRRYLAEAAVPINEVVDESVGHLSRFASQSGIPINETLYDPGESGQEAIVRGDAELLRIAFDNIIRNAIQFSDRGAAVSVEVGAADHQVTIAVRDRGPGAPPEHIEKIFERYAQAPNQKAGRRGTGLGLSIAKGVVELHGGTIRASNHPEGGCVFLISLPVMRAAVPPPRLTPAPAG